MGSHQRFTYSRWDGTQVGFDLDADAIFDEIADDLLYHGDLNAALRRMMQSGLTDRNGEDIQGIRDMLEALRQRKREALENHDLGGVYDDIAQELRELVAQERQDLQDRLEKAKERGDQRRTDLAESTSMEKNMELDMLPPDLAGQVKGLQNYDFSSNAAQERFDQLMEQLREQLMQNYVDQMTGEMGSMSPEDMGRMKDMMAELNHMLEQRERGEETDFDGFMERYGDFFPENPQTLDELLEIMAQRMAAMQAMLNSMTPEQRAQLQELMSELMEDMDLAFEASRLGQNLQQAFPDAGWEQSYDFSGMDPLNMGEAQQLMQELGDIDQLENLLRNATQPGALAEVDLDRARELLGDESARSLERLSEMAKMLEERGLAENKEGKLTLTPRALRRIGQNALGELFRKLDMDRFGAHDMARTGQGVDRDYSTKPYEFGDPFNLNIEATMRNAVMRAGSGTPVKLTPADFEVERTEHQVTASTVLMLDLSMSMPMRDRFLPAKKVVMALHSLISSSYPRDYLGIVGFAYRASELKAKDLPEVSWDFEYGTNMHHGLMLARQMLSGQVGTKQILMITDGEPTAHLDDRGQAHFAYPPIQETVDKTLREVMKCTREGVRINTFMLEDTPYLQSFVEKMTELNRGRAFFCDTGNLGNFVLVDFLEHRRQLVR
jgi:uncharacterized protein with von Willebrand factor type A (vWA) domain